MKGFQMFQQEWKDIPTWEGIYQVSNYARLKRIFRYKDGRVKETITVGHRNKKGYYEVELKQGKRKKKWLLHRLVVTIFQRPLVKGEDAHHKNQMKCCNCSFNIQIKEHALHIQEHRKGKEGPYKGHKHSQQTKQKMSIIKKGHIESQQWRKHKSEAKKGKKRGPMSQEQKRKLSQIMKKKVKLKDPLTGKFLKTTQ